MNENMLNVILEAINGLGRKIDDVDKSLNERIDNLEKSLNARIDQVEASLNARIDQVGATLNARIDKNQKSIEDLQRFVVDFVNSVDKIVIKNDKEHEEFRNALGISELKVL